jgi:hypothetical protein
MYSRVGVASTLIVAKSVGWHALCAVSSYIAALGAVFHTSGAIVVSWVVESISAVLNIDTGSSVCWSVHVEELSGSDAAARIVRVQCVGRTACLTNSSEVRAYVTIANASKTIVVTIVKLAGWATYDVITLLGSRVKPLDGRIGVAGALIVA